MFTGLRLTNFKSWKDTGSIRLAPLTALFGTNSSGKTSLLQSLLLMRQTVESPDRNRVLEMGGSNTLVELGTYRDLIHNHDIEQPLGINVEWSGAKEVAIIDDVMRARKKKAVEVSSSDLGFSTSIEFGSREPVQEFTYRLADRSFRIVRREGDKKGYELESGDFDFKRTPGRVWPLRAPTKFYGFPDQVRLYYQNAAFLSDLELALEEQLMRVKYLGPLRQDPQRQYIFTGGTPADVGRRGELSIDALVAAQTDGKRIHRGLTMGGKRKSGVSVEVAVAAWLKELGLIHSFRVVSVDDRRTLYRVEVQRHEGGVEVLLTDVGFGVSQVLPVLVLLAYAENGDTIIFEQPEIHLHPSVQSGLADIILETCLVRGVQVILESHSEHLLARLQRRLAEQRFGDGLSVAPEDVALYFCQESGGVSQLSALELDLFGGITNWPHEFFGDPMEDSVARIEAASRRA